MSGLPIWSYNMPRVVLAACFACAVQAVPQLQRTELLVPTVSEADDKFHDDADRCTPISAALKKDVSVRWTFPGLKGTGAIIEGGGNIGEVRRCAQPLERRFHVSASMYWLAQDLTAFIRAFPSNPIYTFEPMPSFAQNLRVNPSIAPHIKSHRVHVMQAALGASESNLTLETCGSHGE